MILEETDRMEMKSRTEGNTQCPFCSVQCKMRIQNQQNPDEANSLWVTEGVMNAASEGRLCVKGKNAFQHSFNRERLVKPLLRKDGILVQATWEEALNHIAQRILDIQHQFSKDAVSVYGGGSLTNESAYLLGKFARVALGTKYIDYNGRFCMSAAASAGIKTFGLDRGLTNPLSDIPLAGCIILAGTNIAECQPTLMPYFTRAKDQGSLIVVIDPRETATAQMADLHLKVKPGTDAVLAGAMLKVILEENLQNDSFIRNRTKGFDQIVRSVQGIDLNEASGITGVDENLIRLAATAFGKAETGMIFTARGVEQHADGHMAVRNFLNLTLVTGKVGRPGCGYGAVTGQGNGQGGREHGQKADQLPGYRLIENETDRAYIAGVWGISPHELPGKGVSAFEMMELVHEDTIKAMLIMGSNPVMSNPNAGFVEEALRKLDFLVVADMFLSETAEIADVVLPVTSYLENEGTLTNLEGRVLLREAALPVSASVRHDWQILCELAVKLGKGTYFPFSTAESIFEELRLATKGGAADYYGITYSRLRKEEGVYWPCPSPDHPGTPRLFQEEFGHEDGLAHFSDIVEQPSSEETCGIYPLILTTGRVLSHYLTGVQTRRSPVLTSRDISNALEIHPATASRYGIEEGMLVEVQSRRGSFVTRSRYRPDLREDTVFSAMHWGGLQNVNLATNPKLDPYCRMPDFKSCAVYVKPLQ
ncbi:assimilatory nitrate reductase catalytic subunit NasC [Paenibacillus gansuensis]|uniref:Molybdopterin oxidoreductase family protein n=1 Tax=Paenibacillus gansuensis TaxID=306542 RepID=A0ABW5PJ35_9BACL